MTTWIDYYLANIVPCYSPVRWQDGTGWCQGDARLYATEIVAMRQGYQRVPQLSQRYIYWLNYQGTQSVALPISAAGALQTGVPREDLCPMPDWRGVNTGTQAWTDLVNATARTPPSAAAVADAPNHRIISYEPWIPDSGVLGRKARYLAAIAAGHAVIIDWAGRDHELCGMDFFGTGDLTSSSGGALGLDSHSTSSNPFLLDWAQFTINCIVRSVSFADCALGPALGPRPPEIIVQPPPPPPPSPPPQPIGNTQMLIDTIKADATAISTSSSTLAVGQVTQAIIDSAKAAGTKYLADVSLLVPDAPAPQPTAWATLYADTFDAPGPAVSNRWAARGVGSAWSQANGCVAQSSTSAGDPKKLQLADATCPDNQEIVARVRVDSWTAGDYARAGVSVHNDGNGLGYNLLFHGTNTVQFLADKIVWGTAYPFTWGVGSWYWFKLRMDTGVLYGKVWADGSTEPTTWQFTQRGWAYPGMGHGVPGLNGGSSGTGSATASFDDVTINTN